MSTSYALVRTNNYNNEAVAEHFVAQHIPNRTEGLCMLLALRNSPQRSDSDWYKLVENDYQLWRGMAEFVVAEDNEFFE